MRNDFWFFSKRERRGIIMLATLLLLAIATREAIRLQREKHPASSESQEGNGDFWEEYEELARSTHKAKKEWPEQTYTADIQPPERFAFNPNTADSAILRRLGLPWWMARNIVRYREKGGKFRKAEDFRKIYGMTEEQYTALQPYLRIAPEDTVKEKAIQLYIPPKPTEDSIRKPFKYPEGTLVDLNKADTTELKKIPGIGSGISRMIVAYRKRLGGFYRIEQLAEIHLDYEQLRPWFSISTEDIRRINVNTAGIERLRNHPYLNFYQAKAIVEHRRKNGKLKTLKALALYEEFAPEDLERISHYVCYE